MKPARFDYLRAGTLAEAHATLAADGDDARILAGGQSLLPMLSMRMARPKVLIDIMHLPELAKIEVDANAIRIGAGVRQAKLLAWPELHERQPLLAAALPWVGHAQTRSRGTVCGSVAHADPSAEIPLVLLALKGAIHLSSRQKQRRVPAVDFFTGIMSTARNDDELIEGIEAPCRTPGHGSGFCIASWKRDSTSPESTPIASAIHCLLDTSPEITGIEYPPGRGNTVALLPSNRLAIAASSNFNDIPGRITASRSRAAK